jgi:hypothetical protein
MDQWESLVVRSNMTIEKNRQGREKRTEGEIKILIFKFKSQPS